MLQQALMEMAKDPATKPDCIPVDRLTTNMGIFDAHAKEFEKWVKSFK